MGILFSNKGNAKRSRALRNMTNETELAMSDLRVYFLVMEGLSSTLKASQFLNDTPGLCSVGNQGPGATVKNTGIDEHFGITNLSLTSTNGRTYLKMHKPL